MACGLEELAGHLGDNPVSDPDADPRHGRQEVAKRVVGHQLLDLLEGLLARGAQLGQLRGELTQHESGCVRADDGDGLLVQGSKMSAAQAFPPRGAYLRMNVATRS